MADFNEELRYGSARWATFRDVARAGLFNPPDEKRRPAPFLGFFNDCPINISGDAPLITFAGAGSGKLRDVLGYNVCGNRAQRRAWRAIRRKIVLDPRGELAAISHHILIRDGIRGWFLNPFGLHGLPKHRVNPWDMLRRNSPTLHADVKRSIHDLIEQSKGNEQFFSDRARDYAEALTKISIDMNGGITMPQLYDLINDLENPEIFQVVVTAMTKSEDGHVRRVGFEMMEKRDKAPKEYLAIISTIYQHIGFLNDPIIREFLSGSDFSLDALCREDCAIFVMIPAEYLTQLGPMMRAIFGAAMLYKYRSPAAPIVTFLIDEAAQLGNFESLINAYSFGRGMGIRVWSFWQNAGQIALKYGRDAVVSFIGSSQVRQFFGVRDIETAKIVSAMAGMQTLEYDDELAQAEARQHFHHALAAMLNGADPFESGRTVAHYNFTSRYRMKQTRALISPDEVLHMDEHKQILFISGLNLRPIYADKWPYYARPEMAGAYLPNPYHPPGDRVPIADHWRGWARVIKERVPSRLADWPQYQSGEWSFVEGYRPV